MYFSLFFLQKVYRVGFLLVLILITLDLLAFFYFSEGLFGDLFIATREQTPLTWISSLSMFFLALASLSIYYRSSERVWYFLAAIFFFFSIDDATYLHERISGYFQDHTALFGFFPSYIWVLLYMPLLLFSLGTLVYLVWQKKIKQSRMLVISALALLGSAIFLDFLDGVTQKNASIVFCLDTQCHLIALHLVRLSEEVLEVLALGILGYTLILEYCLDSSAVLTESV